MGKTLHRQRGRLSTDSRVSLIAGRADMLQPVAALPRPGLLVFVRDGVSAANELNVFAGNEDVPLTAFGRAQACEAGRAARGVRREVRRDADLAPRVREGDRGALSPLLHPPTSVWTVGSVTGVAALDERDFVLLHRS